MPALRSRGTAERGEPAQRAPLRSRPPVNIPSAPLPRAGRPGLPEPPRPSGAGARGRGSHSPGPGCRAAAPRARRTHGRTDGRTRCLLAAIWRNLPPTGQDFTLPGGRPALAATACPGLAPPRRDKSRPGGAGAAAPAFPGSQPAPPGGTPPAPSESGSLNPSDLKRKKGNGKDGGAREALAGEGRPARVPAARPGDAGPPPAPRWPGSGRTQPKQARVARGKGCAV